MRKADAAFKFRFENARFAGSVKIPLVKQLGLFFGGFIFRVETDVFSDQINVPITTEHVSETLQYRTLDRQLWS